MFAATYETEGPEAGKVSVRELPDPVPAPGEVVVRLKVSGVNPTDWKTRAGMTATGSSGIVTPNQDGAGVIVQVGDGVDPGRVGEHVWLYEAQWQRQQGTAAQMIALPGHQAVRLADEQPFDLGASLGIPYMTAHRCLFADGPLLPGTPVLVHGGAGAVGHAAIELAKLAGARVATTTSSPDKAALAAAAGADLIVDYRKENVGDAVRRWAPKGVARVIEVDLAHNLEADCAVLEPGGTIICYTAGGDVSLTRALMTLNARLSFVLVYTIPAAAKAAAVEAINAALSADAISTLPLHRFSLDETEAAHEAVRAGVTGKVLIDIP